MRKSVTTIYAMFCTLLLTAGCIFAFVFAYRNGTNSAIQTLCGVVIGFVFSPIAHELGHVTFGAVAKLDCVYLKCFCFKIYLDGNKKRFSFASPFSADQTQMIPKTSGNMQKRAIQYTLGGLIFGGIFLIIAIIGVIVTTVFGAFEYVFWGILPYAAYLFLLNVAPLEYESGKTDMLVYVGLKKGYDAEKNMLAAMEIQGGLYEGKSFGEMNKSFYFDLPQLREDEPLYAVMMDLRYRYYLETGDLEGAADCLNRLAQAQEYLANEEIEKIAAELVYMHTLRDDMESANESAKLCQGFLSGDTLTAKRILAEFTKRNGKTEETKVLLQQAKALLENEYLLGVRKFEGILLAKIEE